ncbi:MAG: hypothetical protein IPI24_13235 [Ignavibacteria bacterium]|nr:hypothetical protein [Ignavibacteria bacterium]
MGPVKRCTINWLTMFAAFVLVVCSMHALPNTRSLGRSTFLLTDTTLHVWGNNSSNQLGLDRTVFGTLVSTPTIVQSPSGSLGWIQISAGLDHTLGLTNSGKLYGFGNPATGRLANASGTVPQEIPVPGGTSTWTKIACGYDHSLALTEDGKLWAFGSNAWGQLGVGDNANRTTPTEVPKPAGVSSWTAVWAGAYHSIALGNDGKLYAWGWNFYGQLGTANTTQQVSPVAVLSSAQMGAVNRVSAGYGTTYAITTDGKLFAWGRNDLGQLGIPGVTVYKPTQVPLPAGATAFTHVSSGAQHVIVTTAENVVYVTGSNGDGQLGDGTTTTRTVLTKILRADGTAMTGEGWAADNATYQHEISGGVWAWGSNAFKQIGDTIAATVYHPRLLFSVGGGGGPTVPADTTCIYSDDQILLDDPNGTQIFNAGADDTTSSVLPIGFTFRFKGTDYTTFTVSSNGLIGLGSTPIPPSATNALTSLTTPALAPFWDDLLLGQYPVMIQNTGQANARSLHITWRGRVKNIDTNAQPTITIHAILDESTQSVNYVYSYGGNSLPTSASIGWSVGGRYVSFSPGRPWTQSNSIPNDNVNLGSGVQFTNTVIIDDSCTPPPPPPPTGVTYTRLQLGVIIDLSHVWFITDLEGFVVGTGGRLFRTIDGGVTWTLVVTGTSVDLTGFRIIDGRWYIYGANGVVRYSLDHGVTWISMNIGVNVSLTDLRFIHEQYGIAVGSGGMIFIWNGSSWVRQSIDVHVNVMFTSIYIHGSYIFVTGTGGQLWRYDGTTWISISLNLSIDITNITMLDGTFGYLIGADGTICRTFDGGLTWSILISGVQSTLRGVYIVSRNIAYVVGDGGICLQTLDGGRTWVRIHLNTSVHLRSITVVNGWGYIVGTGGAIFRFSSDYVLTIHGTTYSRVFTNVNVALGGTFFIDGMRGFMIGDGGVLLRTIDGGISWTTINIGISIRFTSIYTINGIVYICGQNGYLAYSNDGGLTWIRIDLNVNVTFTSLVFVNASYGFVIGEGGVIFRFNGTTWFRETINTTANFRRIIVNGSFVWAIGDGGIVWRYNGRGWVRIDLNINVDLVDITFIDARIGWIIGKGGLAWRTIDGGRTWTIININVGLDVEIRCLRFASRWVGWASCANGLVLQTVDGGRTWIKIDLNVNVDLLFVFYSRGMGYIGGAGGLCWSFRTDHLQFVNGVHISRVNVDVTVDLRHCRFYDAYLGVVVGVDGVLRVTLDGGLTWLRRDIGTTFRWNNVCIVDSILFVVGDNGCIYRSIDLGVTWHRFPVQSSVHFLSIAFIHRNDGFAVGRDGSMWRFNGTRWIKIVLQTNVAITRVFVSGHIYFAVGERGMMFRWNGSAWIQISSNTTVDLSDVSFYDASFGLVVGRNGCVLRTVDGGLTWTRININIGLHINALHIISRELIFAVCDRGVVLRSTNGGTTWIAIHITSEDLTGISFNSGYGWVVGRSGAVYAFTDDLFDSSGYWFSSLRRGIRFNGENTIVDLGQKSSYGLTANLTLMAWVYPTAYGRLSGIIGNHRYVGAGSRGYALVLDEYGHVGMVITKANGTAQWIWSSGIVKINTWSHVSGVFDGTSLQVFINGVLSARLSIPFTAMMPTDDRMMIGYYQGYHRSYFNGSIDNVSIWGAPCPPSHIRRTMHDRTVGIEPWLMGGWHSSEGAGESVTDVTTGTETLVRGGTAYDRTSIVGVGRSWSGTITTKGNIYLGGTDTRLDVTSLTKSVDLVVHSIVDVRGIIAPAGIGRLFPRTWVIRTYGQGTIGGFWKIILGPRGLSQFDINEPSRWVLFRRPSDGSGNWVNAGTCIRVDGRTGELTFPMQNWDGQYILGCLGDSPLGIALDAQLVVQPVDVSVCEDDETTFTVIAEGTNLHYQWRKNGKNIDGANDNTYHIMQTKDEDRAGYDVVVDAQTTSGATSFTKTITLNIAPFIQSQPSGTTVCEGELIDIGIAATGTDITYQWLYNGKDVIDATSYRLIIPRITVSQGGWYQVRVGGICQPWVFSDSVYVSVKKAPMIITTLQDTTAWVGDSIELSVVSDSANVSYQWRKDGNAINGATSSRLRIDSIIEADSGTYDVIITGECGADTSVAAQIKVRRVITHVDEVDRSTIVSATIYPQPADNVVTIEIRDVELEFGDQTECRFLNNTGGEALRVAIPLSTTPGAMTDQTSNPGIRISVDTSGLPSGVYTCILSSGSRDLYVGSVAVLR